MKSYFWRYQTILFLLYIFWSDFFTMGGPFNQLFFNFALFYPLGFLVGYRPNFGNLRMAYFSAFLFNFSTYVVAVLTGISIDSWVIIIIDFFSLILFLEAGRLMGKLAQDNQRGDHL
ncbi:MAG: hypothetical protein Q8912_05465 [Bacillota bacterium]|nr:hypothetical protein [Bacillota bacterium]